MLVEMPSVAVVWDVVEVVDEPNGVSKLGPVNWKVKFAGGWVPEGG